jgi:hypothetical protein
MAKALWDLSEQLTGVKCIDAELVDGSLVHADEATTRPVRKGRNRPSAVTEHEWQGAALDAAWR